jgi:hypothetical protein
MLLAANNLPDKHLPTLARACANASELPNMIFQMLKIEAKFERHTFVSFARLLKYFQAQPSLTNSFQCHKHHWQG